MTKANREKRIVESAEWVWEQAQLRAAQAYQNLGAAVSILEAELPADLSEENRKVFEDQIEFQRKHIEDYLMSAKDTYLKAVGDGSDR